jgi:hypothetical protein
MGLDMYLTKEIYIGAFYEHMEVKGNIALTIKGKPVPINFNKIDHITEQVGYWRKANAIHNWFVKNVQDGKDDCERYPVDVDQMKDLLTICKKVNKNYKLAPELLPVQEGFFFGSQKYDEWYFKNIDDTIKILNTAIKEDSLYSNFYYRASW